MKFLKDALIVAAIFVGTMLFLVFRPGPNYSKDDALTRSFKMPLVALLESGKERATLAELYGGTVFEGDKVCMYYPYPGIKSTVTVQDRLKSFFPEKESDVAGLQLRYDYPEWMVAVNSEAGIVVAMGDRGILQQEAFMRVETIETKEDGETFRDMRSDSASHCFDFADSVFRVDKVSQKIRAVTLTDKDSPADKAFTPPAGTSPP